MSLVNISIVGNVIKPPQQICLNGGRTKTTLVVAVDATNRKNDDGRFASDIYRVEAWGKLGDIAHKYLAKGSLVGATGRLVMDHWCDREGRNRVTPIVEANQIALPHKPKAAESGGSIHNPVTGEMQFDALGSEDTPPATISPTVQATGSVAEAVAALGGTVTTLPISEEVDNAAADALDSADEWVPEHFTEPAIQRRG